MCRQEEEFMMVFSRVQTDTKRSLRYWCVVEISLILDIGCFCNLRVVKVW